MIKLFFRYGFYIAVCCFLCLTATGQERLKFRHIGINEGLSQNAVFCMLQDHDGLIWIGTEDGLNKYDGYDFTIYKHQVNNKNSLSHSQINCLLEDKAKNIWVGTSGGLNVFNPRTQEFTHVKTAYKKTDESENYISSILQDEHGYIWIGTYDGLKMYDGKKTHHFYASGAYKPNDNLNKIKALFEDHNHLLWVSIGNDLKCFDPVKQVFLPLPVALQPNTALRSGNIRTIRQDRGGVMWFGSEVAGVFRFDPAKGTSINFKQTGKDRNTLLANVVRDILIDGNHIWIGTRNGLDILDTVTGKIDKYEHNRFDAQSLSHNSIRSFLKDKSGNIWVGTFSGGVNIYNFSSNNFNNISERAGLLPGLNHSVVSSILYNANGSLWVGTEGGGLNYVDAKKGTYKYYSVQKGLQNTRSNIIKSLARDGNNGLWVGTYDGPVHFNPNTGEIKTYRLNKEREDQDKRQEVNALLTDNHGVWAATNGSGLYFISNDGKVSSYLHKADENSITSDNLTALQKDATGNLWIASLRGLNYFDRYKNRFVNYLNNADNNLSLSNNTVQTLFTDAETRLWIGTQGGLNYFDKSSGKFYAITETDGLPNNVIHAIQQAADGSLWVSTNRGIANIRFKRFKLPFNKADITVLNYTLDDGLQSNQFSPRAAAMSATGQMFFGGINGISAFYPLRIVNNHIRPLVVFTSFEIKNKPVTLQTKNSPLKAPINDTKSIKLDYDQAFISIKFAALNYFNSNKNQYAYRLLGLQNDNEWHYAGSQRSASYTNLEAGTYIFEVKASNNDGVWNNVPRTLAIRVLPPPWRTWWAYLLYALGIGALLYFIYYYLYSTSALKHKLEAEHLLREKDDELAQRKLSFFTNISHEIKTPLTLILAPIERLLNMNEGNNKVQNQLMLMQRNGNRLINLINQLLDFRKFETGNMQLHTAEANIIIFTKEVVTAFDSYAFEKKVVLKFKPEKRQLNTWFDKDKLEKILYNLLSNAIKFTPAGESVTVSIAVELIAQKEWVSIKVEDTGIGISDEQKSHLFQQFSHHPDHIINAEGSGIGLAFTKGLVELHHGEIAVESRLATNNQSGYTCFTVLMPLGKEHLGENEFADNFKDIEEVGNYDSTIIPTAKMLAGEQLLGSLIDNAIVEKPVMLIVEDNEELKALLAESFEVDFTIFTAEDGLAGWEKATEIIPDMIISDVMMPNMSGTMLCNKLKTDPRTSHIPIILLTARTSLVYKIEGLENGADDYITKPFSFQLLRKRTENLLAIRRKLRERYSKEVTLEPTNIAITSPDELFLEKVMKFIEHNMEEPILSVEEMGKHVGMSRATLYRKIKALTDMSAIEFIRGVRLKRAAQLLEQNKFYISEVAYMVGFTDLDYFRKCFKQQFGQTPKDYSKTGQSA